MGTLSEIVVVPTFWTTNGETFISHAEMMADPDLHRRCLAYELAQGGRALSRTDREPAFDGIRLAVLQAAEDIGAVDEFRALMRATRDD